MSPLATLLAADGLTRVKRRGEDRGASGTEGLLVQFMVMRLLLHVSVTQGGSRSNSMGLILDARNVHKTFFSDPLEQVHSLACLVEQAGFHFARRFL